MMQNFPEQDKVIIRFLEHCNCQDYKPRQLIIREGKLSDDLFYIVHGSVTVTTEGHKGHEVVLAYLNKGEFFGEIALFDLNQHRSAFVRAKTKSTIARLSYAKLKSMPNLFPEMLFLIASQMAGRLRKTSRRVIDLAFTDVKGRVARTLLDLCKEPDAMTHPDGMQIRVTRQELGSIAGCSREMVSRVLKSLEEEGLISVSGKTMVIYGHRERLKPVR